MYFSLNRENNHKNYLSSLESCGRLPLAPIVLGQWHCSSQHVRRGRVLLGKFSVVALPAVPWSSRGYRFLSTQTALQRGTVCCELLPYKMLLQSFAVARYLAVGVSGNGDCHRGQSTGAPKSVPVISKGSAEMLQVSIRNDLPVGEAASECSGYSDSWRIASVVLTLTLGQWRWSHYSCFTIQINISCCLFFFLEV